MRITLNGQPADTEAGTLAELVAVYRLDPRVIVIEQNGVIAKKSVWDATPLNAGDQIEIVTFVGGG